MGRGKGEVGKEGRRGRREKGSEEKKMAKESGNDREWTIDELRGPGCDITVLVCVHLSMMVLVLYPGSSPGFFLHYETVRFMPISSKRATEQARESWWL